MSVMIFYGIMAVLEMKYLHFSILLEMIETIY